MYVDIARDYATDGFLLVHRKFRSIRGSPCIIYSDPGKNFVGAASELKKLRESISQEELTRQGGLVGTEWRFHPPDAPHTGQWRSGGHGKTSEKGYVFSCRRCRINL